MVPIKLALTFERSSKRYHVYRVEGGTIVPDKIYVPQTQAGPNPPEQLTLTIEE